MDISNYEIIGKIGSDFSGNFYKVKNKKDNRLYCLKKISIDNKEVEFEEIINIQKKLNHENIVLFYNSFKDNQYLYLIFEYCDNLDLDSFINQHRENKTYLNENLIYLIVLDICKGLKEIHSQNIIHREEKTI